MRQPKPSEPKHLTASQAAALLQVSPKTVSRWAKEGKLPFVRTLGGHRRYPDSEIRALVDSLSEIRLLAQSSLRYRRQILALKQFFVGRQCTVLLLDDRTAEGPDLQLQSIAHGVLSLDHAAPPYGRSLRHLQVVKFRGSDFRSGFHDFAIRQGGLEVYPRLTARENIAELADPAPERMPRSQSRASTNERSV